MNARIVAKLVGASVALAIAMPVVVGAGSALAWSGRQGRNHHPPYAERSSPGMTAGYGSSGPAYRYQREERIARRDMLLRFGPSAKAPPKLVIPGGMRVRVAGPDVHGWRRVESPVGAGWAFTGHLAPA